MIHAVPASCTAFNCTSERAKAENDSTVFLFKYFSRSGNLTIYARTEYEMSIHLIKKKEKKKKKE